MILERPAVLAMTVALDVGHRTAAGHRAGLLHGIRPRETSGLAGYHRRGPLLRLLLPHLDVRAVMITLVVHQRALEITVTQHVAPHDVAVIREAHRILRLGMFNNF